MAVWENADGVYLRRLYELSEIISLYSAVHSAGCRLGLASRRTADDSFVQMTGGIQHLLWATALAQIWNRRCSAMRNEFTIRTSDGSAPEELVLETVAD
jgi:hypothetical protein